MGRKEQGLVKVVGGIAVFGWLSLLLGRFGQCWDATIWGGSKERELVLWKGGRVVEKADG